MGRKLPLVLAWTFGVIFMMGIGFVVVCWLLNQYFPLGS